MRVGWPRLSHVGHPLSSGRPGSTGLTRRSAIPAWLKVWLAHPCRAAGQPPLRVSRLMAPFGETVGALHQETGPFEIIIPAVASVRPLIEQALAAWPQQPHLVEGESDKFTAFKLAHAALAASGTVTLDSASRARRWLAWLIGSIPSRRDCGSC